jgi:hypothetical protein
MSNKWPDPPIIAMLCSTTCGTQRDDLDFPLLRYVSLIVKVASEKESRLPAPPMANFCVPIPRVLDFDYRV